MAIRLKVKVDYKSPSPQPSEGTIQHVSLSPVYSGSEENKKFFAATPGGSFQFYTVNQEAVRELEIGKEYYMDIFAAEAPPTA